MAPLGRSHWPVGWRHVQGGPEMLALRGLPDERWRTLPDDGRRFYADPFPILHDGCITLFVEEFAYGCGRGVISAVPFGPEGPEGVPDIVLEEPYHLSYPFVFAHGGGVWMVPESGANRTIDLYRADSFPGGWTKVATLVQDVVASDATLFRQGRVWWLFATIKDAEGGSFSDCLHLWSAPELRGPWTAHPRNPVLIDAVSARPAGRMSMGDGALIRPVQDCRRAYGGAVVLARVDQLDQDGFAQTVLSRIAGGRHGRGRALHTLNRAGDLEFINGSAVRLRGN